MERTDYVPTPHEGARRCGRDGRAGAGRLGDRRCHDIGLELEYAVGELDYEYARRRLADERPTAPVVHGPRHARPALVLLSAFSAPPWPTERPWPSLPAQDPPAGPPAGRDSPARRTEIRSR